MTVFISYAREDLKAVATLRRDLETLGYAVWSDEQVTGGHDWWLEILDEIRGCSHFLFVMSPASLRSEACLAELEYAHLANRPILPVALSDLRGSPMPSLLVRTQRIDLRERTAESVIALARSLHAILPADSLHHDIP